MINDYSPNKSTSITCSTTSSMSSSLVTAVFYLLIAGGIVWWFKLPLNFDFNSPDFNPMVLLPVFFVIGAIYSSISYMRAYARHSKFGESVLELKGEVIVIGKEVRGVIRTTKEVTPTGDFRVALRCLVTQTSTDSKGNTRSTTSEIWKEEKPIRSLGASSRSGISFQILVPTTCYETNDFHANGTVHWRIEISAPTPGVNYFANFNVEAYRESTLIARAKGYESEDEDEEDSKDAVGEA